ncbi:endolytic transglycosylase MltG [Halioxenophilus aromaticivorans]
MVKRIIITIVILITLAAAGAAASLYGLNYWAEQPLAYSAPLEFEVSRGETLTSAVNRLAQLSVVSIPKAALIYSKLKKQTHIQFGEYYIAPNQSWDQINRLLMSGQVIERSVTLVEGWTAAAALAAVQGHDKITKTLSGIDDPALTAILPSEHPHPEGWFFADTYSFHKGDTDLSIMRRALQKMQQAMAVLWQGKADGLPYQTPYEALVMASIVEKETGVPSERSVIAGVFTRRLQKNMRLQTDPTVIYGLGSRYQGNITRKHLREATTYNTYVIKGLPPTPIALVGQAALDAVFNPDNGKALYFVAKGDGSHYFSETLAEHNKAVREYQILKRRTDYRSTPTTQ